jgi:hypothetical protein
MDYRWRTVSTICAPTLTERSSHSRFKAARMTGEWFCYSAGVEDFVRRERTTSEPHV